MCSLVCMRIGPARITLYKHNNCCRCCVRGSANALVALANPTDVPWQLRPIVQNEFWSGPEFVKVRYSPVHKPSCTGLASHVAHTALTRRLPCRCPRMGGPSTLWSLNR